MPQNHAKLILNAQNLCRDFETWRLVVASEIALNRKYNYPIVVIPYVAHLLKDHVDKLKQLEKIVFRFAANDMLTLNECFGEIQKASYQISFGILTSNENVLAVIAKLIELKQQQIEFNSIIIDSPAYQELCEAVHSGWATVVLSDHQAIMTKLQEKNVTLYKSINDLQIRIIDLRLQNNNHDAETKALNDLLVNNEAAIKVCIKDLPLCGPTRALRTLGSSFILANTHYACLSQEEQQKDKVSLNAILAELELIQHELMVEPKSSGDTTLQKYLQVSQPVDTVSYPNANYALRNKK